MALAGVVLAVPITREAAKKLAEAEVVAMSIVGDSARTTPVLPDCDALQCDALQCDAVWDALESCAPFGVDTNKFPGLKKARKTRSKAAQAAVPSTSDDTDEVFGDVGDLGDLGGLDPLDSPPKKNKRKRVVDALEHNVDPIEEKAIRHNETERRRVDRVNKLFNKLQDTIHETIQDTAPPEVDDLNGGKPIKTKAEVLVAANELIKRQRQQLRGMQIAMHRLLGD